MGPQGPPGICACNLSVLFDGHTIPELLPGPRGLPGIDGKTGSPGVPVSLDFFSIAYLEFDFFKN